MFIDNHQEYNYHINNVVDGDMVDRNEYRP